jgi:hypothetical protein
MKDDTQAETYGNRQKPKRKSSLHLLLQNIQRLPLSIRNQKHEDIVDCIQGDNSDIAILTEVKSYWPKVPVHQQWEERSERLFPQGLKGRFSYNKTETASNSVQYGGAGALAVGETRHRLCSTGEDGTREMGLDEIQKERGHAPESGWGLSALSKEGGREYGLYAAPKISAKTKGSVGFPDGLRPRSRKSYQNMECGGQSYRDRTGRRNDDLRNGPVKRLMA